MKRQRLMAFISVFTILLTACSAATSTVNETTVTKLNTTKVITIASTVRQLIVTKINATEVATTVQSTSQQSNSTDTYVLTQKTNGILLNKSTTAKKVLAEGISSPDKYKANCPAVVCAEFVVIDTKKNYDTGFECWIEKYKNGKWEVVQPLGEIKQENNGTGHFYNINEDARDFVCFDLACYPLLSAGKYRIAKPFWEKGSSDHNQYTCYSEFSMVNGLNTGSKIGGSVTADCKEYPINTKQINIKISYDSGLFARSDIIDIEKKVNGKWVSVRKGAVNTNSIGGSYGLGFNEIEEVNTDNFDISSPGKYRARVSVGGIDTTNSSVFLKTTMTRNTLISQ